MGGSASGKAFDNVADDDEDEGKESNVMEGQQPKKGKERNLH